MASTLRHFGTYAERHPVDFAMFRGRTTEIVVDRLLAAVERGAFRRWEAERLANEPLHRLCPWRRDGDR